MDLEFETLVHTAKHFVENDAALAANAEFHGVTSFHAVIVGVRRVHVDVPHCADDPLLHFKETGRPHQHPSERTFDVAGNPERQIEAQGDAVGVSQFNLVQVSARAKNTKV